MEIGDYITYALNQQEIAIDYIREIKDKILSLSTFPERYPILNNNESMHKDIRCISYKNYYIFYKVNSKGKIVTIIRIGYNRRNWNEIM